MSTHNWPHVLNLSNSIIGVTVLAMPFCYKECGIILGTTLLFFSTWLTLISCQLLMRAGVTSRKRSYGFLAHYTHGAPGKIAVEVGMIGLQIGTLIAQVVIIGDLGPAIVSKWTGLQNTGHLRTALIVVLCLCVGFPLGLLRNLTAVSRASTLCIIFYSVYVLYVVSLSIPNLKAANWFDKVNLWRTDGLFKCLPIFSFAFGCQTQLFILYDALPEPSLNEIKSITSSAVHMCTVAYLLVGFFGYIAFCDKDIGGDIMTQFTETFASDLLKIGFVMSIAITFPLIIFPCRGSLYTLLFPQRPKHHEDIESRPIIPELHFKALTVAIVAVAMITGILVPNVEFVLAMNGATMGTLICYIFPAIFFLRVMTGSSGKNLAQLVLIIGLTIMFLCTYTTLNSQDHIQPQPIEVPKAITKAPPKGDQIATKKPPGKDVDVEKRDIAGDREKKPPDPQESKKDDLKVIEDKRVEPPNPKPPDEVVVEKNDSHLDKVDNSKEVKLSMKEDRGNTGKAEGKSKEKQSGKDLEKKIETKEKKDSTADKEKKSVKDNEKKVKSKEEEKDTQKEEVPLKDKSAKNDEEKDGKKDSKIEEKELIKELKKQQAEQKKLIQEQKEILNELKQHKQQEHDNQQILNEILNEDVQNIEVGGQQPGPVQQQPQPDSQAHHNEQVVQAGQAQQQHVPKKPQIVAQQQIGAGNQQQGVGQQQMGVGNLQQSMGQQQMGVGNLQQSVGQQQMGAGNQQQSMGQQQMGVGNLQQSVGQQQMGAGNQQQVVGQQQMGQQQMGAGNQQQVVGQQQMGAGNEQQVVGQQQMGVGDLQQGLGQQQMGAGNQQQIVGQQQVGVGNQQQINAGNKQQVVGQQQVGVGNQQQGVGQNQIGAGNPQQVLDQQQIGARNLQQGVGQQQMGMGNQQQGVGQQQMGVGNQQQGVGQQQMGMGSHQQIKSGNQQQVVGQQEMGEVNQQQGGIGNMQQIQNQQQSLNQPIGAAGQQQNINQQQSGVVNQQQFDGINQPIKQHVANQQSKENKAKDQVEVDNLKRGKRDVSKAGSMKEEGEKDKSLKQKDEKNGFVKDKHKKPGFDEMRRKKLSVDDGQDIVEDIRVKDALDSLTKLVSPVPHLNGVMRSLKSLQKGSRSRQ